MTLERLWEKFEATISGAKTGVDRLDLKAAFFAGCGEIIFLSDDLSCGCMAGGFPQAKWAELLGQVEAFAAAMLDHDDRKN